MTNSTDSCSSASPDACAPDGLVPSLVLIGTRKGGTTALTALVRRHPRIVMPHCFAGLRRRGANGAFGRGVCVWDKEVRYFSRGVPQGLGMCWYRSLYPCPNGDSGGGSSDALVGFDASPDYLVLNDAAVRHMATALGPTRTRLVALLRNPADRFYSAYNMGMSERLSRTSGRAGSVEQRSSLNATASVVTYAKFASDLDRILICAPECRDEPSVVAMFFSYGMYALATPGLDHRPDG